MTRHFYNFSHSILVPRKLGSGHRRLLARIQYLRLRGCVRLDDLHLNHELENRHRNYLMRVWAHALLFRIELFQTLLVLGIQIVASLGLRQLLARGVSDLIVKFDNLIDVC